MPPRGGYNRGVPEAVRLDVWLDVACVAKTRSQAKELCDGGKVELGGVRAKPHRLVHPGDHIRVTLPSGLRRELVVREIVESHVPRARARELYDDVTPPPTEEQVEMRRLERFAPPPAPPKGTGRPEKRARRQIDRFRGR